MPQKYALLNDDGTARGFVADDVVTSIPAGALPITDEQWEDWVANAPSRRWDGKQLVEITPAPPATPPLTRLYKSEVWRRATDAEAEKLDAALATAPVRLRRLWSDSTVLDTASEDWPLLRDPVVQLLGAARADELLAPTF
ncbi:MAG: hypothetical protein E7K72_22565 [Roseomonas mucosa]|nr:hypothetical protein [Roseomonas mucosa]